MGKYSNRGNRLRDLIWIRRNANPYNMEPTGPARRPDPMSDAEFAEYLNDVNFSDWREYEADMNARTRYFEGRR